MTTEDKEMMVVQIAGRKKRAAKKRLTAARKIENWTLNEWIHAVDVAIADGTIDRNDNTPAAMRIENTMFTVDFGEFNSDRKFSFQHRLPLADFDPTMEMSWEDFRGRLLQKWGR